MTSEWAVATLQDVCATITDGAHLSPREDPNGLPMASVKDLTRHGIKIGGCKRISSPDFEALKRQGCMPKWGDVLIAKDGNSALDTICVHKLHEEVVLLSSVAILRPNEKVDSGFLRYYLDAPQIRSLLKSGFRSGSAIPRVVLKDFRRVPITLPPIGEQRAIAHILGTLDDKIELNRRMNETLEAMARALFKSWFVDFDPVRAKAEGRDPGLPKPLADLFPDSFEDSELGEVPKGWEFCNLGDVADVNWGDTNTTKAAYCSIGFPAYSASGQDGYLPYNDFDETGVVVSAIGANAGHTWLATGKWSCIKNTIRFWATESNVSTEYLFYATQGKEKWPLRGSAQTFISQGDARSMRVLIPANILSKHYGKLIHPWLKGIEGGLCQSKTLAAVRDALLPKLISGELRVKDAKGLINSSHLPQR